MNLLHPTYCARSTVVNKTKSWISQSIYSSWGACVCLVTQSCPVLCNTMNCSPSGSSVHGDPPGKNTGMGCCAILQGIFPPPSTEHQKGPDSPISVNNDILPSSSVKRSWVLIFLFLLLSHLIYQQTQMYLQNIPRVWPAPFKPTTTTQILVTMISLVDYLCRFPINPSVLTLALFQAVLNTDARVYL